MKQTLGGMEEAQVLLEDASKALQVGESARAESLLREAQSVYPRCEKNSGFHLLLGSALLEQGQEEKSLTHLDRATTIDPKNFSAWMKKGNLLKSLGKLELAADALGKATELNPTISSCWFNYVKILMQLKRYRNAFDAAKSAIHKVKSMRKNVLMQKLFLFNCIQAGKELEGQHICRNFVKAYQKIQQRAVDDTVVKEHQVDEANDLELTEKDLDENTVALVTRLLVKCGQKSKECEFWQLACVLDPSVDNVLGLGVCHLDKGQLAQARRCLVLAKALAPRDWQAYHHLGVLDFKEKRYRQSVKLFKQALELATSTPPQSPTNRNHNISVVDPTLYAKSREKMQSRIHLYLGCALLNAGEFGDARHHISCAAHTSGAMQNPARLVLAGILLRYNMPESSMNILNMVRRDLDEVAFGNETRYGRASSADLAEEDLIEDNEEKAASKQATLRDLSLRIHMDTAKLAHLSFAINKFPRKDEARMKRVLELEKSCYQDFLRRVPDSEKAKEGLESQQKRMAFLLNKSSRTFPDSSSPNASKTSLRHHHTEGESAGLTSAEKIRRALERDKSYKEFLDKLKDRRAKVEHDLEDHSSHQHSATDDLDM